MLSIVADQYYLIGWKQLDIKKIEVATNLFPLDRVIALGPAQYYVIKNYPSEEALNYINKGLNYDTNAVDLLQARMTYSLMLGKQKDATEAYSRLIVIAPKLKILNEQLLSK